MNLKKVLKKVPLFTGLADSEYEKLVSICQVLDYGDDEVVFEEASNERNVYILLEGRLKIEKSLARGFDKAILHIVKPGQTFGEFALVDGQPRSATAVTTRPSKVLHLGKVELDALFEAEMHIGYVLMTNIARSLCERIRKTSCELGTSLMWES